MRLIRSLPVVLLLLGASASADQKPASNPPNPEDILGDIVVVAGAGRPLAKIGVLPSLSLAIVDVAVRSVIRRDLDLSGEFEVLPDDEASPGVYRLDFPIDFPVSERQS